VLGGRFAMEIVAPTEEEENGLTEVPLGILLAESNPSWSAVYKEV